MAGIDQNPTELEQPHGHVNQPDDEQKNEHEYQPDNEQEYQPVNENENENEDELAHDFAHVEEQEEHKPEPEDVMTENFQYDEEQDILNEDAQESVDGGGERWPGWPGECVFRMLVPLQKVGRIIGRKGEYIRKTCEETKARIKIIHGPRRTRERVVMVSAKEEPNASLPPAIDCLLRVHKRVVDGLNDDSSHPPSGLGGKVSTRLLVPAAQTGSLIGKQGTTVKLIQEESNCVVRILGTEELPVFTLQDDRIVEVVGEPAGVHKAIELIASQLRKFLVDRSIISLIEMQMQRPFSSLTEPVPPADPWLQPPPPFPPIEPAGPGYAPNSHYMPPPRQFSNYYHPVEMPPPPEKQPHQGISVYGREAPTHSSSSQPAPSVITQVAQRMKIPLSYADAVIGTQGATISYIRRVSGATVTIQEARGVPGEMTIEISGTASQAQTAQLLIQDFMADAPAGPQAQHALLPDYNAYAAHGLGYPPQQPPNHGSNHGY